MRSVQMRRLLFLVAIANVAAVFYSDWADNKCPATFPPYSTGCSWSTSCNSAGVCTTKHRHTCKSKDSAVHYCGDECNELCTSLQGGGAAADVCATDASGNPGGCVHGTCKAEGSPTSAHCYCAADWTGVHCSVPATPSTPSPASPTPSPATPPATPPATSPTPAPAPAPTPAPAPAPSPAPTGSGYCQTNEHNSTTFTQNCNNGACTEASSTFSCTCNSGWSGIYCLTSESTAQPAAGTWQRNVLDRHNTLRANIYSATNGAQPSAGSLYQLVWDYNLEQHAQKYASSHKVFTCSALVHSAQATRQSKAPYSNVGENLFAAGTSGSFDPVSAVNSWFNEYSDYTLSSNTCASGKMCGHYTQVVWKNTYAVGCGLQKVICGSTTWYVVACQYGEAGNFVGVSPYAAASDLQTTVVKTYPTAL